jgi:hypothetical protein
MPLYESLEHASDTNRRVRVALADKMQSLASAPTKVLGGSARADGGRQSVGIALQIDSLVPRRVSAESAHVLPLCRSCRGKRIEDELS